MDRSAVPRKYKTRLRRSFNRCLYLRWRQRRHKPTNPFFLRCRLSKGPPCRLHYRLSLLCRGRPPGRIPRREGSYSNNLCYCCTLTNAKKERVKLAKKENRSVFRGICFVKCIIFWLWWGGGIPANVEYLLIPSPQQIHFSIMIIEWLIP